MKWKIAVVVSDRKSDRVYFFQNCRVPNSFDIFASKDPKDNASIRSRALELLLYDTFPLVSTVLSSIL